MERAETLKAMNRLGEALAAYDAIIEEFPENVVVRNGRADTLKAMNRLEEALAAYDAIIEDFPENVVARSGRADTLKVMNRLEEALAAYDAIIEDFPENVVARNGRAETLKAMNRLEEALAQYRLTRQQFPHDEFARNGEAGVLLALGLDDEALACLADVHDPMTFDDWIALHIRGGIHLFRGELDAAEEIFRRGVQEAFPEDQDYFRSGLAITLLRREKYEMAEEELAAIHTARLQPSVKLFRIHLGGLTHSQSVPVLLAQLNEMGSGYCHGYVLELKHRLREGLPIDDMTMIQKAVSCLSLAA